MNLFYKLIIISAFIFLGNSISAQINIGTVSVGNGSNQIDMTITVNTNDSTVSFDLTGPSSRWFGFGFAASNMNGGAYTILGNVNSGNPMEYNQVNHSNPTLQTTQNLSNISSSTNGGQKAYTFTRAMNTNDANDFIFLLSTSSINLIWAYGSSTNLAKHAAKGTASINLASACNIPVTVLPQITICEGDSAMIFGNYKTQAADYYDTLQTSLGCDSVLKINLSTIQIDTQVYVSNNTLNSAYAFANSYQWYDCQTDQAIAGETNMTYSPTQNGSYKVEIVTSFCSRMSSCHSVNWVGIEEIIANKIKVSPNPVINNLLIDIPDFNKNFSITIISIEGRILKEININSGLTTLDLSFLNSGMYIYKIEAEGTILKSNRFIKR